MSVNRALPQRAEHFKKNEDICNILENKSKVQTILPFNKYFSFIVLDIENTRGKIDTCDPSPYRAYDMYPISPFY